MLVVIVPSVRVLKAPADDLALVINSARALPRLAGALGAWAAATALCIHHKKGGGRSARPPQKPSWQLPHVELEQIVHAIPQPWAETRVGQSATYLGAEVGPERARAREVLVLSSGELTPKRPSSFTQGVPWHAWRTTPNESHSQHTSSASHCA